MYPTLPVSFLSLHDASDRSEHYKRPAGHHNSLPLSGDSNFLRVYTSLNSHILFYSNGLPI